MPQPKRITEQGRAEQGRVMGKGKPGPCPRGNVGRDQKNASEHRLGAQMVGPVVEQAGDHDLVPTRVARSLGQG